MKNYLDEALYKQLIIINILEVVAIRLPRCCLSFLLTLHMFLGDEDPKESDELERKPIDAVKLGKFIHNASQVGRTDITPTNNVLPMPVRRADVTWRKDGRTEPCI